MGKGSNFISTEIIEQISAVASLEAIKAYKDEKSKEERKEKKKRDSVERTKNMLKSYRAVKKRLDDGIQFTKEEQAELRWKFLEDLMGDPIFAGREPETVAEDKEKKRQEDIYGVYMIDTAMRLYEEECKATDNEERKRRFRELHAMYIEEQECTVAEIAAQEDISEKTVYKDIGIATQILAIYLFGFSAIR